jgi:UDP-glucose 4-epimerase
VYGPRSFHKGSVVAAFFKQILKGEPLIVYGDGEQTRDFVFVEDLCGGITSGLVGSATGVFQLGSGRPLSVNQLIAAIRETVAPIEVRVEHRPQRAGEISHTWCDVRKAEAALGFEPRTPLADGLRQTWDWFLLRQRSAA